MDRVLWSGNDWRPLFYAAVVALWLMAVTTWNVTPSPQNPGPVIDATAVIEIPYRRGGDR